MIRRNTRAIRALDMIRIYKNSTLPPPSLPYSYVACIYVDRDVLYTAISQHRVLPNVEIPG